MDSTQNFNDCPTQSFNPLFCFNSNSYMNQNNNNNFNQINAMNQMNNNLNLNFNMNNFNQMNQMNNNINFNMNNFNQLNQMNNNINFNINNNCNYNKDDKINDLFPYIKEQKKLIKFINSDNESNYIKVPISINKSDLYSIADNYKSYPSLKFILSYKNIMIKENESSIEEIPEGAEINIIEERPIPNTCYYDSLKKKYGNENDIRNIFILDPLGTKNLLILPGKVKINEFKMAYNKKYGLNENMAFFIFDGLILKDNDERRIKDLTLKSDLNIQVIIQQTNIPRKEFGKTLSGNVIFKNEKIQNFEIKIGTLESTSRLYYKILENRQVMKNKIKKLYLNNKEINMEDEHSLISLGIKEDFNVIVEL